MRAKRLPAALFAAVLLVISCKQDPDYVLPSLRIANETIDFATGDEQSVGIAATRDWMVRSKPDWIAIDPDRGTASDDPQWVTITALPNDSYDRTGAIVFTIGLAKAEVTVNQPGAKGAKSEGTGTLEDPYTVAGALAYVSGLAADAESAQDVYIKGRIATISEPYSSQFGNASFFIKDEDGEATFQVYRAKYLGNRGWKSGDTQIAEGDEVVVCGKVVNFKGNTPETAANKAFLYSLNGKSEGGGSGGGGGTPAGSGTQSDPYNVAAAVAAVANLTWTSTDTYESTDPVYVKGIISRIADNGTFTQGGTFGNATFFLSDDGATSNELEAYRILYLGNKKYTSGSTDIKVGDEVVIYGKLMNYRGNTPETVQNGSYLYSLNGQTEGGGSGGGGDDQPAGEVKTVTVAAFNAASPSQTQKYQLTGKVSGTINTQYGNFDLVDDTGTVYVYGLTKTDLGYGAKNDQSYASLGIKAGDTVTLIGYRADYQGKIEVVNAYYVSHTSGSGEGDTPDDGGQGSADGASGEGTQASPYNAAAAAAAVKNLTWTSSTVYDKTDPVYVKGKISKIASKGTYTESGDYGNASFYISEDGKTTGTQFYIFRALYFGKAKYTAGTDIKVGDEVVVYGPLMNYQGNTPETVANEAYLISLNGKTE